MRRPLGQGQGRAADWWDWSAGNAAQLLDWPGRALVGAQPIGALSAASVISTGGEGLSGWLPLLSDRCALQAGIDTGNTAPQQPVRGSSGPVSLPSPLRCVWRLRSPGHLAGGAGHARGLHLPGSRGPWPSADKGHVVWGPARPGFWPAARLVGLLGWSASEVRVRACLSELPVCGLALLPHPRAPAYESCPGSAWAPGAHT